MKNVLIIDQSFDKGKSWNKPNSLEFECSGAVDFSESIKIELCKFEYFTNEERKEKLDWVLDDKEKKIEFEKIHPYDLYCKLSFPHLDDAIRRNLGVLIEYYPHISDKNLRKDDIIYYRCYREFHHSHWPFGEKKITFLTLDKAIKEIKKEKLDLVIL